MDGSTARATKATELNGFGEAGKISKYKAMPPQLAVAMRAVGRFLPGKKTAKAGNFLDLKRNKQYQLNNSFQDGLDPAWRGWWICSEVHHPIL
ncbi:MAG: hypothetical protein V2I36_14670 [Desulfopila sp.]|nr:hypothetical protein [Desulfopila sp.]